MPAPRRCDLKPWWPACLELTPQTKPPKYRRLTPECADGDVRCVVDAIWTAGGYGWELWYMHEIVQCESGWDPTATGAGGEAGLFQIHPVNWALFEGGDPWDVENNTRVALKMRAASGWSPWSCAR